MARGTSALALSRRRRWLLGRDESVVWSGAVLGARSLLLPAADRLSGSRRRQRIRQRGSSGAPIRLEVRRIRARPRRRSSTRCVPWVFRWAARRKIRSGFVTGSAAIAVLISCDRGIEILSARSSAPANWVPFLSDTQLGAPSPPRCRPAGREKPPPCSPEREPTVEARGDRGGWNGVPRTLLGYFARAQRSEEREQAGPPSSPPLQRPRPAVWLFQASLWRSPSPSEPARRGWKRRSRRDRWTRSASHRGAGAGPVPWSGRGSQQPAAGRAGKNSCRKSVQRAPRGAALAEGKRVQVALRDRCHAGIVNSCSSATAFYLEEAPRPWVREQRDVQWADDGPTRIPAQRHFGRS